MALGNDRGRSSTRPPPKEATAPRRGGHGPSTTTARVGRSHFRCPRPTPTPGGRRGVGLGKGRGTEGETGARQQQQGRATAAALALLQKRQQHLGEVGTAHPQQQQESDAATVAALVLPQHQEGVAALVARGDMLLPGSPKASLAPPLAVAKADRPSKTRPLPAAAAAAGCLAMSNVPALAPGAPPTPHPSNSRGEGRSPIVGGRRSRRSSHSHRCGRKPVVGGGRGRRGSHGHCCGPWRSPTPGCRR